MDRDGFQGWSRRSEAAHERIFGPTVTRAELEQQDWGIHDAARRRLLGVKVKIADAETIAACTLIQLQGYCNCTGACRTP